MREYKINLLWDKDTSVWIATSTDEDISGLILESDSLDALIERIKIVVPELIELNEKQNQTTINIVFDMKRCHETKRNNPSFLRY